MEAAMITGNGSTKEKRAVASYRVFLRVEDDQWRDVGTFDANGASAAKKAAYDSLALSESDVLAAVGDRFWKPTSPTVTTTSKVEF